MPWKRIAFALFRIGLVAAVLTWIFWAIFSRFAPVPATTVLHPDKGAPIVLHVSRWFDPLWVFISINAIGWLFAMLWNMINRPSLSDLGGFTICGFTLGSVLAIIAAATQADSSPLPFLSFFVLYAFLLAPGLAAVVAIGYLAWRAYQRVVTREFWTSVGHWLIAADKEPRPVP